MNVALHQLVYLSQNDISCKGDALNKEITQILRAARENNTKQDITGALMFNSKCFAQVLEGPHHQVQALYDRIERDTRHSGVKMLSFYPIDTRSFPNWSMAYVGNNSNLSDRFFMIAEETNFNIDSLSGEQVLETLLEGLKAAEAISGSQKAA